MEIRQRKLYVVYFDQRLSAAHQNCWSKSAFFVQKAVNTQKKYLVQNLAKKQFFCLHQNGRPLKAPTANPRT